jgi:hypothetical protein
MQTKRVSAGSKFKFIQNMIFTDALLFNKRMLDEDTEVVLTQLPKEIAQGNHLRHGRKIIGIR